MSYGKAIRLRKHHGNRPHVLKTVQKTSFKTIDTDMACNHSTNMSNFVIPKVMLTCPSEEWPIQAKEVEEKAESRRAAFWDPPFASPSPFQKLVYKLTTCFKKISLPLYHGHCLKNSQNSLSLGFSTFQRFFHQVQISLT